MQGSQVIQHSAEATVSDYIGLLKPRVMSLVVFTGFAGMWVSPGFDRTHPFLVFGAAAADIARRVRFRGHRSSRLRTVQRDKK